MKCYECGKAMRKGLLEVSRQVQGVAFSAEIQGVKCPSCGTSSYDGPALGRFERAIAVHLAREGMGGRDVFRFVRKAMGIRAIDLADLLGVVPETISRWEHGKVALPLGAMATLSTLVVEAQEGNEAALGRLRKLRKPPKATRRRCRLSARDLDRVAPLTVSAASA